MSLILGYDRDTLRERVDLSECRDRLEQIADQRSLAALLERAFLLKMLGELDDALKVSEQSVRLARMAGTRKDLLRARVLHASVVHWRGGFPAAVAELTTCANEAEGQGWPHIAAFAMQHLGKVHFDAGALDDARAAFKRSLFFRQQSGANDAELETTFLAIDAVERRLARESTAHADEVSVSIAAEQASAEAEATLRNDPDTLDFGEDTLDFGDQNEQQPHYTISVSTAHRARV